MNREEKEPKLPLKKGSKMGGRTKPPRTKEEKARKRGRREFMTFPTNEDYVGDCLKKP